MEPGTNVLIRQEAPADHRLTEEVVRAAFEKAGHASGTEFQIVRRLRAKPTFVPELSLVAEAEGKIVGHILFTPVRIVPPSGQAHRSLALAPVSVVPGQMGKGIGSKLIEAGHRVARELGYRSSIVLGHPAYYPRFGYERASLRGIRAPFEVPDEAFMALELVTGGLAGVAGTVEYPPELLEA